jgi:PilZ domain-containing protein
VGLADSNKQAEVERILPRHEFDARVKVEVMREGKTRVTDGWARDLSENGLGAFVGAELIIGETATLRIPLSSGEVLLIPAQVTRKVGTEYGFQFTALSPKQRDQIQNVLATKKIIPFDPAPD